MNAIEKRFNIECLGKEQFKEILYEKYLFVRNVFRTRMKDQYKNMDRHKIASMFLIASLMISHCPDGNESGINEIVGFFLGWAILKNFIRQRAENDNDTVLLNIIEKPIIFPKSNNGHFFKSPD